MPCVAAPIGSVWAAGSWSDTAWCEETWADAVIPPVVVQQGGAGYPLRRVPRLEGAFVNDDEDAFVLALMGVLLND